MLRMSGVHCGLVNIVETVCTILFLFVIVLSQGALTAPDFQTYLEYS